MTPAEYVRVINEHHRLWLEGAEPDRRTFNLRLLAVKQGFANQLADAALEDFYDEVLRLCTEPEWYERIRIRDMQSFEDECARTLLSVLARVRGNSAVKGIYVEYFHDGGDSCYLYIYPSLDDLTGRDWHGELLDWDMTGPKVSPYIKHFEIEPLDIFAREYADAHLLAAWIRIVKACQLQYPLGFAEHGKYMVCLALPRLTV